MNIFGRRILPTTLDPVPRLFRCVPGLIAMNMREVESFKHNDGVVFKELADICQAEDWAEATLTLRPKIKKRKVRIAPSVRLSMLNAAHLARKS